MRDSLKLSGLLLLSLLVQCCRAAESPWSASLAYVNSLRARHRAPPVSVNENISLAAQEWADAMAEYDLWYHSKTFYGENIAMGYSSSGYDFNNSDRNGFVLDATSRWYNEVDLYDFAKPGWSNTTGHFTQLVWTSTREIGIGVSYNPDTKKVYVVMNYLPPGNYENAYEWNVYPEVKVLPLDGKKPPMPRKMKFPPPNKNKSAAKKPPKQWTRKPPPVPK